jgi:hypothetical protein
MGQVIIPFDTLRSSFKVVTFPNPKATTRFELQSRPDKKDKVSGAIFIQYSWSTTQWLNERPARKQVKKELAEEKNRAAEEAKLQKALEEEEKQINAAFKKWEAAYGNQFPSLSTRAREIAAALCKHDEAVSGRIWGPFPCFDYLLGVGALAKVGRMELLGLPLVAHEASESDVLPCRIVLQELFFKLLTPHPTVRFTPHKET